MRSITMTWIASAAVVATVASGCGGGATMFGQPAAPPSATAPAREKVPRSDQLVQGALDSLKKAKSARMSYKGTVGGQTVTAEIAGNREGTNQQVKINSGDTGSMTILTVDGQNYIKASKAFWSSRGGLSERQAKQVADKFVATQSSEVSEEMKLDTFLNQVQTHQVNAADMYNTKVEEDSVNGQKAYKLTQRIGTDDATVWISADGSYHLLRVTGTIEGQTQELAFADWNAVQPFEAPPNDQIVTH